MKIDGPRCRRPVPAEDLNVAQNTALCRKCGEVFHLSSLLRLLDDERLPGTGGTAVDAAAL